MRLSDLRFFVSDAWTGADGNYRPAAIIEDGRWQTGSTGLIDLEDGTGSCLNGSSATNDRLRIRMAGDSFDAIRFTLGVPFEINHDNPLTAPPPLNDSIMHWHWRSGYKFLRAGIRSVDDGFWMHLGSTGCTGTIGNIEGCTAPNRATITIEDFDPETDVVVFDLGVLFSGIDLTDGDDGRCMAAPGEDACRAPFEALGLQGENDSLDMVFYRANR